ncbi:RNA polymerase sigma factor [Butyricimonas paravirosa]
MDGNSEQLITGLREGREKAFAQVFRMYYGPLLNYAGRILKDVELANDVVQECFCRLYERRKEIKREFQVRPYLYKSVYNSCIDAIKHQKVENNYINQELLDFYFSKVVETPEAEQALLDEDLKGAIQDAINKLPERCREIFVLSKVDGLSNKQIAEQLNISIKTVEAQMTTAFVRLRKELGWLLCFIFIQNF